MNDAKPTSEEGGGERRGEGEGERERVRREEKREEEVTELGYQYVGLCTV